MKELGLGLVRGSPNVSHSTLFPGSEVISSPKGFFVSVDQLAEGLSFSLLVPGQSLSAVSLLRMNNAYASQCRLKVVPCCVFHCRSGRLSKKHQ